MLEIDSLVAGYGRIEVLHGVSIRVGAGQIATLIGANGAGKTTLLRAISGVQPVTAGMIRFDGRSLQSMPSHTRVAFGIAQVPEGRQLFAPLSVEDNLKLGAWARRMADGAKDLARIYALFPILGSRRDTPAGSLSGGQQQMLAIGRALMAKPRLLLLDEPSTGLAPIVIDQILDIIRALKSEGMTVLLVEQNVHAALALADRVYVLETGRITASGNAAEMAVDKRVREAYLGI